MSFDAVKILGEVIHKALDNSANDFQREARAVIDAIQADTQQGAELRQAILGHAPAPALWSRLDKTAPVSAQNIEWYAPFTTSLIVADYARGLSEKTKDPKEAAMWKLIAEEIHP